MANGWLYVAGLLAIPLNRLPHTAYRLVHSLVCIYSIFILVFFSVVFLYSLVYYLAYPSFGRSVMCVGDDRRTHGNSFQFVRIYMRERVA